jgi:hypothetical protein
MQTKIIGRIVEQKRLSEIYSSDKSEFVAIFGRRRVGKTFLVRQVFENQFAFELVGLAKANTMHQLVNFNQSLNRSFATTFSVPNSWLEAFDQLQTALVSSVKDRKVVFIDEISWLDTAKSGFLSALEHFWNAWACWQDNIVLIICGSATSWIVNNIINNRGGLHNRLTANIHLQAFTLRECEQYFQSQNIEYSRYQIAEVYMLIGGIPYYLSLMKKGLSVSQNIDIMFFDNNALLKNEFNNLYNALFKNPDEYIAVVKALSARNKGLSRREILQILKLKSGTRITKILQNLEYCGFIRSYFSFNKKERCKIFQLIDSYTLFYYNFIAKFNFQDNHFWSNSVNLPQYNAWSGYAFEILSLQHLVEIKRALGISGIRTNSCSWKSENVEKGCQIDLLIDRIDGIIDIVEIKFSNEIYSISKNYEANLRNKISVFRAESKTRKAIHLVMLTNYGVLQNKYSGIVQNEIVLDDLFKE